MSSDPSTSQENVWLERGRYEEAETAYQEHLAQLRCGGDATSSPKCEKGKGCPVSSSAGATSAECFVKRIGSLETENKELRQIAKSLETLVSKLTERVTALEKGSPAKAPQESKTVPVTSAAGKKPTDGAADDDDFELFGSDDEKEDTEAERVKQERLKAYEEKKSKKPQLIAKSNIILDVKPWDDETDMAKLEECVRSIVMDGLLWGASKLVPLAYGIKKLQISCVVEDDKVSTDDLEEKITAFEDFIQSMDIAAFNKI